MKNTNTNMKGMKNPPVNIAERSALIRGVTLSLPVAVELSVAHASAFQNFQCGNTAFV